MRIQSVFNPDYNKHPGADGYERKLQAMAKQFKEWIYGNPGRTVTFQSNHQKGVVICSTLKDALDHHFVSANDDALEMFRALGWLESNADMPSVLMVQVIMEKGLE